MMKIPDTPTATHDNNSHDLCNTDCITAYHLQKCIYLKKNL